MGLIDDILDFSKIEAQKIELDRVDTSLSELLKQIQCMVLLGAQKKGIEFRINASAGLPKRIYTDPTRLSQCLINLIGNAIKFTEQGHVHLNISIEGSDSQAVLRFDIEDTGIGIAPEHQKRVFDSFEQADGSTTRKYGGTGLGLSITKKLIELLGGQVYLTSQVNIGTTFSILLPVAELQPPVNTTDTADSQDS